MTTWIQPSEHIAKASEYITEADDMAAKSGVNVETISRLDTLTRMAQVHADLALVKRTT